MLRICLVGSFISFCDAANLEIDFVKYRYKTLKLLVPHTPSAAQAVQILQYWYHSEIESADSYGFLETLDYLLSMGRLNSKSDDALFYDISILAMKLELLEPLINLFYQHGLDPAQFLFRTLLGCLRESAERPSFMKIMNHLTSEVNLECTTTVFSSYAKPIIPVGLADRQTITKLADQALATHYSFYYNSGIYLSADENLLSDMLKLLNIWVIILRILGVLPLIPLVMRLFLRNPCCHASKDYFPVVRILKMSLMSYSHLIILGRSPFPRWIDDCMRPHMLPLMAHFHKGAFWPGLSIVMAQTLCIHLGVANMSEAYRAIIIG